MIFYNVECTIDNKVYELVSSTEEYPSCSNCVADNDTQLCLRLDNACTKKAIYPNSFWIIKRVPE